jgi:hypothetical protein
VANVERHEKHFEDAAMWYRRSRSPFKGKRPSRNANDKRLRRKPKGKRMTPFVMHKRMTQIANAARKLLRHLEVTDPAQAPDGPGNAILEVLASAEDGSEDAVIRATSRIGRLVEILEAVDAARELEHRAHKGAEDVVQIGKLIVPKGHHGEAAVNDWIAAMMSIYRKITGKHPRTSVIAPGRPGRGKAAGPLIRFLEAAGEPLRIRHSPDSWRGRVQDIRTAGRRRRK